MEKMFSNYLNVYLHGCWKNIPEKYCINGIPYGRSPQPVGHSPLAGHVLLATGPCEWLASVHVLTPPLVLASYRY